MRENKNPGRKLETGRKDSCVEKTENGKKRSYTEKRMNSSGRNAEKGRESRIQKGEQVCPVQKKCGGCQFQGTPYAQQLKIKQRQIEKLLKPFGKVCPIIGMDNPYHYRNKVHAAFGRTRTGEIISGTYQENTHKIIPVEQCLIEDQKSAEIICSIRGLLKSFKIKTYDEDTGYGLLRHVLVRRGFQSGQIMVVLVLASPILPSKNNFVAALRKLHPEITTIILNINDKKTSMVLGEKEKVLYGPGYIEDALLGKTFRISAKSFYQINPVQTEILYQTAVDYADLTGKECVLDAYCGIGTIGLIAASKAKEVIGVELNGDAVRDARINAKRNAITNAKFYNADAGKFMIDLADQNVSVDVVFMDPPRAGSDEAFLSSVVKLQPKKVVYISCNPETLARDLKYLTEKGYRVEKIQPTDMFCFTDHVESIVLLSKLHTKQNIEVELEMSELDLTAAESKATYEEIKDYVLEHMGLKVSGLYIAQVKQKCGIIERANYNLPKSGDSRQPKCPPEKETAIRVALEHFHMI